MLALILIVIALLLGAAAGVTSSARMAGAAVARLALAALLPHV